MSTSQNVEVRVRKKPDYWIVDVDPWFEPGNPTRGFRSRISVSSKYEMARLDPSGDGWIFEWTKAIINWSSAGDVNAGEAAAMAEACQIVSDFARRMDEEHKIGKVASC
jgi:hypothetical protein